MKQLSILELCLIALLLGALGCLMIIGWNIPG